MAQQRNDFLIVSSEMEAHVDLIHSHDSERGGFKFPALVNS